MLRDIKIRSVLNGWVVEVGCQTVVFNDLDTMLDGMREYFLHPDEMERYYLENSINSGKLSPRVERDESEDDSVGMARNVPTMRGIA